MRASASSAVLVSALAARSNACPRRCASAGEAIALASRLTPSRRESSACVHGAVCAGPLDAAPAFAALAGLVPLLFTAAPPVAASLLSVAGLALDLRMLVRAMTGL